MTHNKVTDAVARNILNQCFSQTPCGAEQPDYGKAASLIAEHVEDTQTKLDIAVRALKDIQKEVVNFIAKDGYAFRIHKETCNILNKIKGE